MGALSKVGRGLFSSLMETLGLQLRLLLLLIAEGFAAALLALIVGLLRAEWLPFVLIAELLAAPVVLALSVAWVWRRYAERTLAPLDALLGERLERVSGRIGPPRYTSPERPRSPRARYSQRALLIELDCPVSRRFSARMREDGVRTEGFPHRMVGDSAVVFGPDLPSLDRLLAHPGVPQALDTLLTQDGHSLRSLIPGRGALMFKVVHLPREAMTPELGNRWLEALTLLADALEREGL